MSETSGLSPQALPEFSASLLSDQVFQSPRSDLFLRRAHAEPSAASPSPRVPSLQEPRQDGQGTLTALQGFSPQGLVPSEPASPGRQYPALLQGLTA